MMKAIHAAVILSLIFAFFFVRAEETEKGFFVSHAEIYFSRTELVGKPVRVQGVLELGGPIDAYHLGNLYANRDDYENKRFKNALYLELKGFDVRPKGLVEKGVEALVTGVVRELPGPIPGMKRPMLLVTNIMLVPARKKPDASEAK